jgi:hypothetical protein
MARTAMYILEAYCNLPKKLRRHSSVMVIVPERLVSITIRVSYHTPIFRSSAHHRHIKGTTTPTPTPEGLLVCTPPRPQSPESIPDSSTPMPPSPKEFLISMPPRIGLGTHLSSNLPFIEFYEQVVPYCENSFYTHRPPELIQ